MAQAQNTHQVRSVVQGPFSHLPCFFGRERERRMTLHVRGKAFR